MKPLLSSVVAVCLLAAVCAAPEKTEEKKNLSQSKEPIVESEDNEPQKREERCTNCGNFNVGFKSHNDVLARIQAIPGAEIHTQQSFEGCSSDKGCAGLKVKDGRVIERFGNLDAFRAAAAADSGNEFQFHAAGSLGNVFEGGVPNGGPYWWMNENSPFKAAAASGGGGNYEKFSKSSSSYSTTGNAGGTGSGASFGASLDLSGNPFLNGEVKPASFQSSSFESSSFSTSNKGGEIDISKNPFLNGGFNKAGAGFQAQAGFAGGQYGGQNFGASQASQASQSSFAAGNKFGSGYTGSSPSPFTASTGGANINLIQNRQKANEFEFEQQQQTQQNIDEVFQGTGNVHAHEHSGGELQQTCAGQGYVCVHKAQCNNGVVNTNGVNLLQAKTKKQYCNTKTEICCRIEVSSLTGAGGLQGSLGVGSATFQGSGNQGGGLFVSSSQAGSQGAAGQGFGQGGIAGQSGFAANGAGQSGFAANGAGQSGFASNAAGQSGFASQSGTTSQSAFGQSGIAGNGVSGSGISGQRGIAGQAGFGQAGQAGQAGFGQAGQTGQAGFGTSSFESSSTSSTFGSRGTNGGTSFGVAGTFGTGVGANGIATNGIATNGIAGNGVAGNGVAGNGVAGNGANGFGAGSVNRGVSVESSSSSFESRGSNGFGGNKFGTGSTTFGAGGFGPTVAPVATNTGTVYKQTSQTNFVETDSFSSGSENAGVYRPGGLKPGVPYLPPVDSSISATGVSSTVFPTTFVTSPRPFTPVKPTYLPPVSSTSAPGYLPPVIPEQSITSETRVPGPTYSEGGIILDETRQPPRKPVVPIANEIPSGCAAALKCTPIEFCTAEGVISNTTVALTRDQEAYRVPLTDCKDLESGRVGKCCRDPYYTDPWPTNQLGKWVKGVFGGNDGQYTPDSRGSGSINRPVATIRPPITGSVLLNNVRAPKPTVPPFGPNQVTPGFPSTTVSQSSFGQKGQFEIRGQGQFGQGGQGQFGQGGQGQYAQGGVGQFGVAGQGAQGSQGGFSQTSQSSFSQSSFNSGASQLGATQGQGQLAGQGQLVSQGQGQLVNQGQGQLVSQGQGQIVSQGQGAFAQQGAGEFAVGGRGQFAAGGGQLGVGGGQLEIQGAGAGAQGSQGQFSQTSQTSKGFGQAVISGQGQAVSQGFGQGVRQGSGFTVSQGSGFNVENEYSESVQRVFLSQYTAGGQCGVFNGQKPYGNRNENEVDFAEIPWQAMVLLQTNKSLLCGGVITRPDVVVTSAACVDGLEAKNVLIKGGEWKLGIDDEPLPFQIVQVKNILRHPFYKRGSLHFDAAILVLSENLRFAKNIYPICLPRSGETLDAFYNGAGECIVTGWGKQVLQAHLAGAIMHSLNVSLLNPGECQAKLQSDYPHLLENYDQDSCACGVPTNPTNNICRVDIGSALACTTDSQHWVLRGVYSWDSGCQLGNQLAAFYKFDLEWYEWAIGLIESARFAQFSSGSAILGQNRFAQPIKGSQVSGVKGGVKGGASGFGVKGQSTFSQSSFGTGQAAGFGAQRQTGFGVGQAGFGAQGQTGFAAQGQAGLGAQRQTGFGAGQAAFGAQKQTFGAQGQAGFGAGQAGFGAQKQTGFGTQGFGGQFSQGFSQYSTSAAQSSSEGFGAQVKGPISNSFSASYAEKKVYQTEPKIVTYTTKPEIVTFTTKPEYFTFTTKPKIVTYTTKPQIIRYETSGSVTNPQYVAPGVTVNPSFGDVVGAHSHTSECKCLEGKK